jgi:hypothetical protein
LSKPLTSIFQIKVVHFRVETAPSFCIDKPVSPIILLTSAPLIFMGWFITYPANNSKAHLFFVPDIFSIRFFGVGKEI